MSIGIINTMSSDIDSNSPNTNMDINLDLSIYDECPICLEDLVENIAKTNCGHNFHFECLSNWIHSKKKIIFICPSCNQNPCEITNVYSKNMENEIKIDSQNKNKSNNKRGKIKNNSNKISVCKLCIIL